QSRGFGAQSRALSAGVRASRRREVSLFDRQDILCLTANNAGSAVRSVKTAADIGCVRKSHKLGEQRRMSTIVGIDVHDVRFPTSRDLDGSDAMNPDPDYSAAYLVVRTDAGDDHEGHGFVFTIGRGNDVQSAAIE